MPTKARAEDRLLMRFVEGYDGGQWANAKTDWVDKREDGGVDLVSIREDGVRLAIEHTLVEFFIGERADFENFKAFLSIETDARVTVPGKLISIEVPRGTLVPGFKWNPVVEEFRTWLVDAVTTFPEGDSFQSCPILSQGIPGGSIRVRVTVLPSNRASVFIRRYGDIDLGSTVAKALAEKLPKLSKTTADRRVLIFERNQFRLIEGEIFAEVERRRADFPALARVELWVAETIDASYLGFRRYIDGKVADRFSFNNGQLHQGW